MELIFRGFFVDVVDDEDGCGTALLFEFEAELPVDRVEERECTAGVGCAVGCRGSSGCWWSSTTACCGGSATGGSGSGLVDGAEAEGEVVGAFEARGVEDRAVDVSGCDALKLFADLCHGHVLTGEESVEDGGGGSWIFPVGSGTFGAAGAAQGVCFFEFWVYGCEGVGGDGPVLHVCLEVEAIFKKRLNHVLKVYDVDLRG